MKIKHYCQGKAGLTPPDFQTLLEHSSLMATDIYTHVAASSFNKIKLIRLKENTIGIFVIVDIPVLSVSLA